MTTKKVFANTSFAVRISIASCAKSPVCHAQKTHIANLLTRNHLIGTTRMKRYQNGKKAIAKAGDGSATEMGFSSIPPRTPTPYRVDMTTPNSVRIDRIAKMSRCESYFTPSSTIGSDLKCSRRVPTLDSEKNLGENAKV